MSRTLVKAAAVERDLPMDQIQSDGVKLRPIDEATIQELMKSFTSKGQQQRIKVRPSGGAYVVVFGEHRLEAGRRLKDEAVPIKGLPVGVIKTIVEPLDAYEALELKATENAHRNHFMDPWEEGRVYSELIQKKYNGDVGALADSLGKSTRYITDRTNVYYNLDPSLREFVGNKLTVANTISLARISPREKQVQLAEIIIKSRTPGPTGFGGGVGRLDDGRFASRTKVRALHQCSCGCGHVHFDLKNAITIDPSEDGIGVRATIGRGKGGGALDYHFDNPSNPGYSYCGHALNDRWIVEIPEHLDTRTFRIDGEQLCDLCARQRRKTLK